MGFHKHSKSKLHCILPIPTRHLLQTCIRVMWKSQSVRSMQEQDETFLQPCYLFHPFLCPIEVVISEWCGKTKPFREDLREPVTK